MSTEDRYSAAEFARRYKVTEADLTKLCERAGIDPDTVLTRDEFRKLLEEFHKRAFKPRRAIMENLKEEAKSTSVVKEKKVKNSKKASFSRLAAARKLTPARVAALKICTGWKDDAKITEAELDAAIEKHLKNRG